MKPSTVFLGEMTNPEVEAFLKEHHTVIVPTGATEQHGPHAPLLTDVLIPQEVARRAAPRIGAVVAPPINYALSYPHVGFTGLVHIRIPTFMALVEDLCAAFAATGFKRIVFLNGHYDNTYAIAYACANAAERMPEDVKAFPINYWDGMPNEVREKYSSLAKGMHANAAETSAILAINPRLVDMEKANAEFPELPRVHGQQRSRPHGATSSRRRDRSIGRRNRAPGATRVTRRPKLAKPICRPASNPRLPCSRTSSARSRTCRSGPDGSQRVEESKGSKGQKVARSRFRTSSTLRPSTLDSSTLLTLRPCDLFRTAPPTARGAPRSGRDRQASESCSRRLRTVARPHRRAGRSVPRARVRWPAHR